jgi:hypothetical protein
MNYTGLTFEQAEKFRAEVKKARADLKASDRRLAKIRDDLPLKEFEDAIHAEYLKRSKLTEPFDVQIQIWEQVHKNIQEKCKAIERGA